MSGTSGNWQRPSEISTTSLTPQVYKGAAFVSAQADAPVNVADALLLSDGTRIESGKITWTGHGLTVGAYYFTSQTTPGAITATPPTTGLSQRLFFVEDANTIHVDVEPAISLDDSAIPIPGEIRVWAGSTAPAGWMLAQGQSLPISAHTDLFNTIGTTYGGDGVTTFNLPDLRGRFALGADTGYALGSTGGSTSVALSAANIPAHTHTATTTVSVGTTANGVISASNGAMLTSTAGGTQTAAAIYGPSAVSPVTLGGVVTTVDASTGTGTAVDTTNPYQSVNFIIYTENVAASAPAAPLPGEMRLWAGSTAPTDWLFAHGQVLNIASYPDLYATIGTTYGGDGVTTFALPNLKGRFALGADGSHVLGTAGGAATTSLSAANIPAHTHTATTTISVGQTTNGVISASNGAMLTSTAGGTQTAAAIYAPTAVNPVTLGGVVTTINASTGTGAALSTLNPYQSLNYIIYAGAGTVTSGSSAPPGSPFYLAGGTTDAETDKTGAVYRSGFVGASATPNFTPLSSIDTDSVGAGIVVSATTAALGSTNYTVVLTGSGLTQALPAAVARRIYNIKNAHASSTLTVSGHIDNVAATTRVLQPSESRTFHSDGATWWVI